MNKIIITVFSIFIFLYGNSSLRSQTDKDGVIKGEVLDYSNSEPIEGATVRIPELDLITSTDKKGYFEFPNLIIGFYNVFISHLNYTPYNYSVNLIDSNNHTSERILLKRNNYTTDTIKVEDDVFLNDIKTNISHNYYDYIEMQRAPGSGEDIIRFIQNTSGIYLSNDGNNDLIVRGGSPTENLFLIDGIEIQNPNHFATPGSTHGVISFINLKMVEGADFYSGAFPSIYGDKLSSVLNIHFREGNKDRHLQDLNLSMTGFGGIFEGPVNKHSSYIFSVRRSYLELIKKQLNMAILPNYWDFNLKMNYDFSKEDKLSLMSFLAIDNAEPIDEPYASDLLYSAAKHVNLLLFSSGLTYKKKIRNSVLKFNIAFALQEYNIDYGSQYYFRINLKDKELSGKVEYDRKLFDDIYLNIILGSKYLIYNDDIISSTYYSQTGYFIPNLDNIYNTNTYKIFSGINITQRYFNGKLIFNTGIRFDYFDYMDFSTTISPRFGLTYELSTLTTINAGFGVFYQTPEMLWLNSHPSNRSLKSMQAKHYIVGLNHFFSHDYVFNLELFHKDYRDYPVSVYDPYFNYINSGTSIFPNFLNKAVSAGEGYFEGIDVSLYKKFIEFGFHGRINFGLTRSKFKALMGDYQPSEYDYGCLLSAIGSYEFHDGWQIGMKFRYTPGRPYTPIDVFQSTFLRRELFDMTKFNAERMPEYVRLDIRVGKKFQIEKTMINIYIEILNVLNRKNISYIYWSVDDTKVKKGNHISIIPILGASAIF